MINNSIRVMLGLLLLAVAAPAGAQEYDLLLKGGHVIDPKNQIDARRDIAVKDGKIARVAANIPNSAATRVVDVSGLYVTPGLIDIHGHVFHGTRPNSYLSNGLSALPPDGFTFRSGVTTIVDVGGAGWREFPLFKEQVIDRSQTRVLAFLNVVEWGMRGHPWEQDFNGMDPKMIAVTARSNRAVVGVKIAHYNGHDWEPYRRLVEAGELAGIPVMVDFGSANPALSLETLFHEVLRPGDIYTHVYGGSIAANAGRQAVVDENRRLRAGMLEAQERGIIFDVGHGGGSFFYEVAVPAFKQGLRPNTISTDLHTGSMNAGMKDILNVASKMMDMGMSLQEVIEASTWTPAKVIKREELGHLGEGAEADIAVLGLKQGSFGFVDSRGFVKPGNRKLEAELTLRAGRVVWDLNGRAGQSWEQVAISAMD